MKPANSLLVIVMLLFSCGRASNAKELKPEPSYLLEATELVASIVDSEYRVIDFRKPDEYAKGHIPGATNIWRSDLEDSSYAYGGMKPSRTQLEKLMSERGVSAGETIVIYDDNGLCNAARLWWILHSYGYSEVLMLHGGLEAWTQAGAELSTEQHAVEKGDFSLPTNLTAPLSIERQDLLIALNGPAVLLDTRTEDEYSGARHKKGAFKAGRIPGSMHIDWAQAVDYNGDLRIKPLEELVAIYQAAVPNKHTPIIVYCHSGVRSAHTTFVLSQLLGYTDVRNYDGSWTEWSHFDDLPFETDTSTFLIQ